MKLHLSTRRPAVTEFFPLSCSDPIAWFLLLTQGLILCVTVTQSPDETCLCMANKTEPFTCKNNWVLITVRKKPLHPRMTTFYPSSTPVQYFPATRLLTFHRDGENFTQSRTE